MKINFLLSSLFLSAGITWGGGVTVAQADACLDYNLSHNNCSQALTGTLNVGNDTLHFTDVAVSTFGIMHVSTQNSFTVHNDQAWSYGFVSFDDTLTINSAGHQGQIGFITLGYTVDGTESKTGISDAFTQVVMRVFDPTLQNWVDDFHGTTPLQTLTHQFQIVYGTPFELYFSMQATGGTAQDFQSAGYNFISGNGSGTSNVNFSNTFVLTQLTTQDGGKNPLGDTTFQSASGTNYSQQGVAPEPVMFFPAGIALLGFSAMRLRRRA